MDKEKLQSINSNALRDKEDNTTDEHKYKQNKNNQNYK